MISRSYRKVVRGDSMKEKNKIEVYLHCIMCLVGGFMAAYALLNRFDILGSAQTSNMIHLVFNIIGRDGAEVCIRLGALAIYILAMLITVFLMNKTSVNLCRYAIMVNAAGFFILPFIPKSWNPILALYPVFFMTATQWCVFHGAKGYSCSTIFSTNNLKQTVVSIGTYFFKRDKTDLEKGLFFLMSLFWYHLGVAISYISFLVLGLKASFLCLIPISIAFYFSHKEFLIDENYKSVLNS